MFRDCRPLPQSTCKWSFSLQSIDGLENAQIIRPGYAIEYATALDSLQMGCTMATVPTFRGCMPLAAARQFGVNEEAVAAQGLIAGIKMPDLHKISRLYLERSHLAKYRHLIDDLVTPAKWYKRAILE